VVKALEVRILGGTAPTTRGYATTDLDAYQQYLIGRQAYYQFSAKSFRLAVEAYERALALDPGYAPAWAGLGIPLYYLADGAGGLAEVTAQRRRALAAAERAVALAPHLSDALSTRGVLRGYVAYDWSGARQDFERTIAMNGNDADSHRRYACYLANAGRISEAIVEARKAVDLDPLLGPSWVKLADLQKDHGELDAAEASIQRALQILPDSNRAATVLAKTLLLKGKLADARAAFERCPSEASRLFGRSVVGHALGNRAASDAALKALIAKYAHVEAVSIAQVYAVRGERDAAFRWLDRALAQRDGGDMVESFRTTPLLEGIRDDPRYVALLKRMDLPTD
jgi:tetratricopeptide (TPR) repeat protein